MSRSARYSSFLAESSLGKWPRRRTAMFGDPVMATALLDRLLHHATVVQIEGASYRLREHADLIPEHARANAPISPPPPPRRRGRPPKTQEVN